MNISSAAPQTSATTLRPSPASELSPRLTVEKMHTVRAAAMAPAQPSSADLAVAAQAMQTLLQAQVELAGPAVQEPLGARQARDTYARVSAFGDDNSVRTTGFLNISV